MKNLLIFVPSHRKKTGGFRTGKGSFPVGSDSSEKCGKTDGFGPEKQAKKGFSTVQTATYSFSSSSSGCVGRFIKVPRKINARTLDKKHKSHFPSPYS